MNPHGHGAYLEPSSFQPEAPAHGDRKGVTVLGPGVARHSFPNATAFERHADGSLSVFEEQIMIAIFEPGFGGAFMTDSSAPAQ